MSNEPLKIYHKVTFVFGDVPEVPSRRELANGTIEACAQELEAAYAECSTLSLLHGAARLRSLKEPSPQSEDPADSSPPL